MTVAAPLPPRSAARPPSPSSPPPPPSSSSRLNRAALVVVACAAAVALSTLLWAEEMASSSSPRRQQSQQADRRQLGLGGFLDTGKVKTLKYGRADIDQNYQALLRPSSIDSSLFRRATTQESSSGMSLGYTEENACDDIFLFMPYSFAHNGHGSQLNNYMLAAMIATFSNRAMVVLEPPPFLNVFKSNSQFGCPPEAWETVMVRTGGKPKKVGWDKDFPRGLSRLVKHPAWLSRQCPVPCQVELDYEDWDERRLENNQTMVPFPHQVKCTNDNGRQANVIVMGGKQVRDYFWHLYRERMLDRSQPPSIPAAEWALRLGGAPHEARVFGSLDSKEEIYDYASALMARAGFLRFQPWIARDVETYMQEKVSGLPLDAPYYGVHVRRGDKLESDARPWVRKYWGELGLYDEETGDMPQKYIPFEHYLSQIDGGLQYCKDEPHLVYVATDDPEEVGAEIDRLPTDDDGNVLRGCHKFKFVMADGRDESIGFHIDSSPSKGDCDDRYERNIASIADLMILTKSDVFVGEYNSNWGRLVRTFRLILNNSAKVMNGARPVIQRDTRVAWGRRSPEPPGW